MSMNQPINPLDLEFYGKKLQAFKWEMDANGEPIIRIGHKIFKSPKDAILEIQRLGITEVSSFAPGMPLYKTPGSGPSVYHGLEDMAEKLNLKIDKVSFKAETAAQHEALGKAFGGADTGLYWGTDSGYTGLRFFDDNLGRELNRSEIMTALKGGGFGFNTEDNLIKRLKFLVNKYEIGARGLDLKVGVFDPVHTGRGEQILSRFGFTKAQGESTYAAMGAFSQKEAQALIDENLLPFNFLDKYNKQKITDSLKVDFEKTREFQKAIEDTWYRLRGEEGTKKLFKDISEPEIMQAGMFMEGKEVVLKSFDGQSFMSADAVRKVSATMDERASKLTSEAQSLRKAALNMADGPEKNALLADAAKAENTALKMQRGAKDILRALKNEEVYNIRAMGFTLEQITEIEEYAAKKIGKTNGGVGVIKGNVQLINKSGNRFMDAVEGMIGKSFNKTGSVYDIVSGFSSYTTGVHTGPIASGSGIITLKPAKTNLKVMTDTQTYLSETELFTTKSIRATNVNYIKGQIQHATSNALVAEYREFMDHGDINRVSQTLRNLIDQAENLSVAPGDVAGLTAQKNAKAALASLEAGIGPMENPALFKFYSSMMDEFNPQKSGMPRFIMPGTIEGSIGNTLTKTTEVAEGFIKFERNKGFRMHDLDYQRYYRSFGGNDLDDTLRQMLRYDESTESFVAAVKRTPNALGEVGAFNVALTDDSIHELAAGPMRTWDPLMEEHIAKIEEYENEVQRIGRELKQSRNEVARAQKEVDNLERAIGKLDPAHKEMRDLADAEARYAQLQAELSTTKQSLQASRQETPELLKNIFIKHDMTVSKSAIEAKSFAAAGDDALPKFVKVYDNLNDAVATMQYNLNVTRQGNLAQLHLTNDQKVLKILEESIEKTRAAQGVLGEYSNARMILDNLIQETKAAGNLDKLSNINDVIKLLEQETVIDAMTKDTGAGIGHVRTITNDMLTGIADLLHGGAQLDKDIIENQFGDFKLKAHQQKIINDRLEELGAGRKLDSYLIDGQLSKTNRAVELTIDEMNARVAQMSEAASLQKQFENELFSVGEKQKAKELMDTYRQAEQYAISQITEESIGKEVDIFGVSKASLEDLLEQSVQRGFGRQEFMRSFSDFLDSGGQVTEEGQRILGAMMKYHGREAERIFAGSDIESMISGLVGWNKQKRLDRGSYPGMSSMDAAAIQKEKDRTAEFLATLDEDLRVHIPVEDRPDVLTKMIADKASEESLGQGYRQSARSARELAADVVSRESSLPKLDMAAVKMLAEEFKWMKPAALIAGGVIGVSAIYQHFKGKDRTVEDMQGPPLLPGGSFYEDQAEANKERIINNSSQSQGYGVTYNVRATGDFDAKQLSASMHSITGANVRSTSYQSRNFRAKDPISEAINKSFR